MVDRSRGCAGRDWSGDHAASTPSLLAFRICRRSPSFERGDTHQWERPLVAACLPDTVAPAVTASVREFSAFMGRASSGIRRIARRDDCLLAIAIRSPGGLRKSLSLSELREDVGMWDREGRKSVWKESRRDAHARRSGRMVFEAAKGSPRRHCALRLLVARRRVHDMGEQDDEYGTSSLRDSKGIDWWLMQPHACPGRAEGPTAAGEFANETSDRTKVRRRTAYTPCQTRDAYWTTRFVPCILCNSQQGVRIVANVRIEGLIPQTRPKLVRSNSECSFVDARAFG
ncbi:hypothetical protein C8Q80DRAFT_393535 [Daedaleopsis nitida]|nr:hypothetical protein C8Q80DRAFT_393535 [Daedaleopsis nitida]